MAGFKDSFEDRAARSRAAREKALAALANRPAVDPEVVAQRKAAAEAKAAAQAEKSAARKAAIAQAKADKAAAAAAPTKALPTAEEMKAARDARYAARKARQR